MAKSKFQDKLKRKSAITGRVINADSDEHEITFEDENGNETTVGGFPEKFVAKIDDKYGDSIVTVELDEDGNYSVEYHDDWPNEKKK